jgi:hypothetical protein
MSQTLTITAIELFERPIPFTHPFRFGAVTVDGTSEAYVRVTIAVPGRGSATGAAAELMVPKWFDKAADKTAAQTVDDLRLSLHLAARAYAGAEGTAFAIHAARHGAVMQSCAAAGLPPLAANFGIAQLDKAVLDALFQLMQVGAWQGLAGNLAGLDARLTPDLESGAIAEFLARRAPVASVAVRHTVGFLDDVTALPATLATTGCRYVKLKLSGDPAADHARLAAIATHLPAGVEGVSVDANEQYDPAALPQLAIVLNAPDLASLRERLIYVEQPVARHQMALGDFAHFFPCVLDEGDDSYDAFPRAIAAGWRGVSSKSCKGVYKAMLNALRAERGGLMLTAEDLTAQPGLAFQQDTALASFLGLRHMERNGHCYTAGFADAAEGLVFAQAWPELYREGRVRIVNGAVATPALGAGIGYASLAYPRWERLAAMKTLDA